MACKYYIHQDHNWHLEISSDLSGHSRENNLNVKYYKSTTPAWERINLARVQQKPKQYTNLRFKERIKLIFFHSCGYVIIVNDDPQRT